MANAFETEVDAPEMENLAGLAENLVYRLPGCSDLMVRKTLQEVYRDFCRRSCCLRARRQFILSAGQREIRVAPVFGGMVDAVVAVTYNRRKLFEPVDYVTRRNGGAEVALAPRYVPRPGTDERSLPVVHVEVVEVPNLASERVPSFFLREYGDAVCSGALARLMAMTGRAWTDAAQAADERVRYENAVSAARMKLYTQNDSGDMGFSVNTSDLI